MLPVRLVALLRLLAPALLTAGALALASGQVRLGMGGVQAASPAVVASIVYDVESEVSTELRQWSPAVRSPQPAAKTIWLSDAGGDRDRGGVLMVAAPAGVNAGREEPHARGLRPMELLRAASRGLPEAMAASSAATPPGELEASLILALTGTAGALIYVLRFTPATQAQSVERRVR
jgi:hypothetical protein